MGHLTTKFGMPYALPYALPIVQKKVVPYTYPVAPMLKTYARIFKREAEAKPDPLTVYTHNAYAPYTYTTPYTGYPYINSHFIAKREAEAEADPLTVYKTAYPYANYAYNYQSVIPKVYTVPQVYNNAPVYNWNGNVNPYLFY